MSVYDPFTDYALDANRTASEYQEQYSAWKNAQSQAMAQFVADPSKTQWDADGREWNHVKLGPYELPGICELEVETSRKLDVHSPPGSDGASVTDKGYQGAKVKIKLVVWLEEHRIALQTILPAINPRRQGKEKKGWDIDHPATAFHDVKSVYIEKIKGPKLGSVQGTKELEIECLEWFAPNKMKTGKTTTPTKSAAPTREEEQAGYSSLGGMSVGRNNMTPADAFNKP